MFPTQNLDFLTIIILEKQFGNILKVRKTVKVGQLTLSCLSSFCLYKVIKLDFEKSYSNIQLFNIKSDLIFQKTMNKLLTITISNNLAICLWLNLIVLWIQNYHKYSTTS